MTRYVGVETFVKAILPLTTVSLNPLLLFRSNIDDLAVIIISCMSARIQYDATLGWKGATTNKIWNSECIKEVYRWNGQIHNIRSLIDLGSCTRHCTYLGYESGDAGWRGLKVWMQGRRLGVLGGANAPHQENFCDIIYGKLNLLNFLNENLWKYIQAN